MPCLYRSTNTGPYPAAEHSGTGSGKRVMGPTVHATRWSLTPMQWDSGPALPLPWSWQPVKYPPRPWHCKQPVRATCTGIPPARANQRHGVGASALSGQLRGGPDGAVSVPDTGLEWRSGVGLSLLAGSTQVTCQQRARPGLAPGRWPSCLGAQLLTEKDRLNVMHTFRAANCVHRLFFAHNKKLR